MRKLSLCLLLASTTALCSCTANFEYEKESWTSNYLNQKGQLSNAGFRRMIKDSYKFCEETVKQGSVLLKNNIGCLPLKQTKEKSLY